MDRKVEGLERSRVPAADVILPSSEVLLATPRWAIYSQTIRGTHLDRSNSAAVVTALLIVLNPVLKDQRSPYSFSC